MINQPTLGSKLLESRTGQGLTQQQLREKCHVSVRTIQRIESGAVTPRASTVKMLLEALGEDETLWFESAGVIGENKLSTKKINDMLLINANESTLKDALMPSWIAGIVYLFLTIVTIGIDSYVPITDEESTYMVSAIIVKVLLIVSFFIFMRGFISLSQLFENPLLKTASYLSVAAVFVFYVVEIWALIFVGLQELAGVIGGFSVIALGAISVILGVALLRLQDGMGKIARVAGKLEIAFGIAYMTLIFSFLGVVLLAPVIIVEVVLLSKADQLVKQDLI